MADAEDYEANKKLIEEVCREPANSECSDCGANGTRWVSVNHGLFVCIRCSGIHRSLGTHITKVKSTNLDKWTMAEVRIMQMVGNKNGRALFEARLPSREKPSETDSDAVVREFIIKKYDDKKYAAPDWVPTLKKVFKAAGYKAGKKALKEKEEKKGADGAAAAEESTTKKSSKKDKKSKGAETGLFGVVNVPVDQQEERLAAVLQHFGLVAAPSSASPAAPAEGGDASATAAAAPAEGGDATSEPQQQQEEESAQAEEATEAKEEETA